MTNQHLITPPPELVEAWIREANHNEPMFAQVAVMGAQWGADQELEACCAWFQEFYETESWVKRDLKEFRAARRPKPPSLKKQALVVLINAAIFDHLSPQDETILRRALEALDD